MYQIALHVIILAFPGKHPILMSQEGTTFDHDFYVVVGKQCRTENVYAGYQYIIFI